MVEVKNLGDLELSLVINRGFTDEQFDSFVEMLETVGIFFGGSYDDILVDGILDISSADITLDYVETLINDFVKNLI